MKRIQIVGAVALAASVAACAGSTGTSPVPGGAGSGLRGHGGGTPVASIKIVAASSLPLGQTMTFAVQALNKKGAPISGAFDHPLTLAAKHLTFVPAQVVNGTQAKAITATWEAGFEGTSSDTIVASADGVTEKAAIAPATGFAYYNVGDDPSLDHGGFQMATGPDGKVYWGTVSADGTDGVVGQLDPHSGAAAQVELHAPANGLFFSHDGALWVAGATSGKLFRMPPGQFSGGALQSIAVPAPAAGRPFHLRSLTEDGNGYVWFSDLNGHRILKIPEANPAAKSIVPYALPSGPAGTLGGPGTIGGIDYGSDGMIYALDQTNGLVDRVDPATGKTTSQTLMPQQVAIGSGDSAFPRFITHASTKREYFSFIGTFGYTTPPPLPGADQFLPAKSPKIAAIQTVTAPGALDPPLPDSIAAGGTNVYYADLAGALGYINASNNAARLFPAQSVVDQITSIYSPYPSNGYHAPNGVTLDADGKTAWFTCYNGTVSPFLPLCLGHSVYLGGWSIFPGPAFSLYVGAAYAQPVGMMEDPGASSAPFKVKSSSSACAASAYRDHNFLLTGVTPGTCTVTVTDKNGNKQSVTVTVLARPSGNQRAASASQRAFL